MSNVTWEWSTAGQDALVAVLAGVVAAVLMWAGTRVLLPVRLRFSKGVRRRELLRHGRVLWEIKYENGGYYRGINSLEMVSVVNVPTQVPVLTQGSVAQFGDPGTFEQENRRHAMLIALPMTNDSASRLGPGTSRVAAINVHEPPAYIMSRLADVAHDLEVAADQLRGLGDEHTVLAESYAARFDTLRRFLDTPDSERTLEQYLTLNLSGDSSRSASMTVTATCIDSVSGRQTTRLSPRYVLDDIRADVKFADRAPSTWAWLLRPTASKAARWWHRRGRSRRLIPFEE